MVDLALKDLRIAVDNASQTGAPLNTWALQQKPITPVLARTVEAVRTECAVISGSSAGWPTRFTLNFKQLQELLQVSHNTHTR